MQRRNALGLHCFAMQKGVGPPSGPFIETPLGQRPTPVRPAPSLALLRVLRLRCKGGLRTRSSKR